MARPKLDPAALVARLQAFLAERAESEGAEKRLTLKEVGRAIGCSHTYLSPKAIQAMPPARRPQWVALRDHVDQAIKTSTTLKLTASERVKQQIKDLKVELAKAKEENTHLWIWMLQIEAGLQDEGINTELFLPESLRYSAQQRRTGGNPATMT